MPRALVRLNITNTSMNKSLLRKTKMNRASNLKARLLFVLAITFVGNSRLAAGNDQNAGRKLDEIPGEYFFEFWSTTFLSSSSLVLAKLLCIYACFLVLDRSLLQWSE